MIKISAAVQKKLPLPGHEYSSQSFSAGIEVEAADADSSQAIKHRVQELYAVLEDAVNGQIDAAMRPAGRHARNQPRQGNGGAASYGSQRTTQRGGNGNGHRRTTGATQAQQRAIFAICEAQGLNLAAVLADYNVTDARDLTVADASHLIDSLKAQQNGPVRRR